MTTALIISMIIFVFLPVSHREDNANSQPHNRKNEIHHIQPIQAPVQIEHRQREGEKNINEIHGNTSCEWIDSGKTHR